MSLIKKEVDEIVASITVAPAVYRVIKSPYGEDIRFEPVSRFTLDSESIFASSVRNSIYQRLNVEKGHTIDTYRAEQAIKDDMIARVKGFLRQYQESKKPNQTILYKWYNQFLRGDKLRTVEFSDALINILKYLNQSDTSLVKGSVHANNGIGLLTIIKDKFEKRGWKYVK